MNVDFRRFSCPAHVRLVATAGALVGLLGCATGPGTLRASTDARIGGDAERAGGADSGGSGVEASHDAAVGPGPDVDAAVGPGPDVDAAVGPVADAAVVPGPDASAGAPFPAGAVERRLVARRVSGPVLLDGHLDEWRNAAPVLIAPSTVGQTGGANWNILGDEDLSATVGLLWDDGALYVAARVVDDDPLTGNAAPGEFWNTDSVALFFDLGADRSGSAWQEGDDVVALLARDASAWLRRGGPGGPQELPAEGVTVRAVRTAVGYDLEARIPVTLLSPSFDTWPAEIGFSLFLGDPAPGDEVSQIMWSGTGDDQSTWGTLTLDGRQVEPPPPPGLPTLDDLFAGRAHFEIDQDPALDGAGHREAFAVERPDLGAGVVYLYHRCFLPGHEASICLATSQDGGDTWPQELGEIVAPSDDHIFSVAPTVVSQGGRWYMVYEESNVAAAYWADSDDGVTWMRRGLVIPRGAPGAWDEGAISTPSLFRDNDGQLYLFYAGFPVNGRNMEVGLAQGFALNQLSRAPDSPVFHRAPAGWDAGQVSMPRLVREGDWYYLFYEGADLDFTCDVTNRYGWGVARSHDLRGWERCAQNPIRLSDQAGVGCGNDMPQPFVRSDGHIFVYHTSGDASRVVREVLRR